MYIYVLYSQADNNNVLRFTFVVNKQAHNNGLAVVNVQNCFGNLLYSCRKHKPLSQSFVYRS